MFTVSFFGHRIVNDFKTVEETVEPIICDLLETKPYVRFLVGRHGDFDSLSSSCINRVRREHEFENGQHTLVLPYSTAEYENNYKSFYNYYNNVEICEASEKIHFKAAIQTCNRYMVDISNLVICYINHCSGGAYQTIEYAKRKNKPIINLSNHDFKV